MYKKQIAQMNVLLDNACCGETPAFCVNAAGYTFAFNALTLPECS